MNLKQKLATLLLATTIIPAVIIILVTFVISYTNQEKSMIEHLEVMADLKVDKIETFFGERKSDIETAQDYYNIKTNLSTISQLKDNRGSLEYLRAKEILDGQLKTFQKVYEYIDVVLLNKQGEIVYVTNEEHSSRELGQQQLGLDNKSFENGKNGVYFGDIFKNPLNENLFCMIISAPLFDLDDEFIGVIALEVNMMPIYAFIQDTTGLGETGETLIAQFVHSHPNGSIKHIPETEDDYALFLNPLRHDKKAALERVVHFNDEFAFPIQKAVQGEEGFGKSTDYRNEEILAVWRHIPSKNWGLVTKMDTKEVFAPITFLRNLFVLIGIIVLIIIIGLAIWISNKVSLPIRDLAELTEKVSRGQLAGEAPRESKRKDEIGILIKAFYKMANTLQNQKKEKSEFIITASHQLKTPATGVRFQLQSLKKKLGRKASETEINTVVEELISNNARVVMITNNMFKVLELGKYVASDLEKVKVGELINDIIKSYEEDIEKSKLVVSINVADNLEIIANERWIKEAMIELVDNAVKYSDEKGTLDIKSNIKNNQFYFQISDTGIGIPQKEQIHIFEEFFRASNSYLKASVGSGLGLVITKTIVEGHEGEISFTSKEGEGTTFSFVIPIKS